MKTSHVGIAYKDRSDFMIKNYNKRYVISTIML